ncbi:phosphoenolpyruvate synthase [Salicibibacter cibarius]|uniref:Phosphoenolpyruvate synthase n=1 Tax=Salicibibacter cibarius TaxID=2743000 RepID=A0A7T6Z271_9BACI|nr:phosphoenolpyruvate synthase [Salicibibacter cibarius]QQK75428.1 phosphoenolpyruvate synthase [Salicibibacter cibarius]
MDYILDFHDIDRTSLSMVGGKGANLGELSQAGFLVPPGFCVTTAGYKRLIQGKEELYDMVRQLDQLSTDQFEEIQRLGQSIRDYILNLEVPEPLYSAIMIAWKNTGKEHTYAIRSSATAEDLPHASFAGQQDSFLNVKGEEQLFESIQKCWASLFTDRAIVYRAQNGFDHRSVFLSIVVQRMIRPEVSGIMFTADPVSGHRHTVSIDVGFGLGEALVSGEVTADLYKVRDGQITDKKIAKKEKGIFPLPGGGTEMKPLPVEQQDQPALNDARALELANLGKQIEEHYGTEQDIEWSLEEGQLYILQSRPITSLFPIPASDDNKYRIYFSLGHKQMMTDYMKPLGLSLFQTLIPSVKEGGENLLTNAGGRLFVNYSYLLYMKSVQKQLKQKTYIDLDLRALQNVVLSEEFEKRIPKRGNKKKVVQLYIKPIWRIMGKAIPRTIASIYFENPTLVLQRAYANFHEDIHRFQQKMKQYDHAERIRLIKEHARHDLFQSLTNPVAYTFVGMITFSRIQRCVKKWLGEDVNPAIHQSQPGNITSEIGMKIGDLVEAARPYPEVVEYLHKANDETFVQDLKSVEGGEVFLTSLHSFMANFGMRASGEIDITRVRWHEAPTMLVPSILSHMRNNAPNEHHEKFAHGEQEARETIQALLERVKTRRSPRKAKKLSRLLTVYRHTVGIRELPKYVIVCYFDVYRRVILEEAKYLVQRGDLYQETDIYYLTLDELIVLLEKGSEETVSSIPDRKNHEKRYRTLMPPSVMSSDGEIFSAVNQDQESANVLVGTPVSAGVVEGTVKVVRSLEEGELNKGDILVAPYTDPGWTPLFSSAKALITEVGGTMTHGSVVARENGIPAVVSVENATKILKDDQMIRVDGTGGFVEILDDEIDNAK